MKGTLLVLLQFALILMILIGGPVASTTAILIGLQLPALILVCWAFFRMGKHRFSVLPQPVKKAVLITDGPYRYIRHPMYTAVLLFCLGSVLQHPNTGRVVCWILLQTVLVLKIRYEESLLRRAFSAYDSYARRTAHLLPGVW